MLLSLVLALCSLTLVSASALAPRASNSPQCTYSCPSTDQLGFPVGNTDTSSDPIFCSYPAVPGENPSDFYCKYDKTTSQLVTDNDAGLCAPTASSTCTKKRGIPKGRKVERTALAAEVVQMRRFKKSKAKV